MQSELTKSTGFAIELLRRPPNFPEDFGPLLGVREDFHGASVFLYRS